MAGDARRPGHGLSLAGAPGRRGMGRQPLPAGRDTTRSRPAARQARRADEGMSRPPLPCGNAKRPGHGLLSGARRVDGDCHAPLAVSSQPAAGTRNDPATACCWRTRRVDEGGVGHHPPLPTRAQATGCRERGGPGDRGVGSLSTFPLSLILSRTNVIAVWGVRPNQVGLKRLWIDLDGGRRPEWLAETACR